MNIILDPWIPILCRNGEREFVAPWQLTDNHDKNPIVAIDAPRPDFNGALHELLIAILQASVAPPDEYDEKWGDWLDHPPSPDTLRQAMTPLIDWFNLDSDGPRFMQDMKLDSAAENAISGLLIDAPGGNTIKNNADHFVKRGALGPMCPEAAAAALWTLQSYAPSGGVGHRTSLRGGGPLTTLVVLDPAGSKLQPTLWRNLWLNVLDQQTFNRSSGNPKLTAPSDRYPWLAPTRTSEAKTGTDTYAEHVHPLQMYFAMPRRTRLDFDHPTSGQCSIYGTHSDQLITAYATKNYGINYNGNWEHPLSPHRKDPKTGQSIPIHPQPGGISYRHWPTIALGNREQTVTPALVVRQFFDRKLDGEQLRIVAMGYDMDNMKARGWCDATMPLYHISAAYMETFTTRVEQMVTGAEETAGYLRSTIKQAWFDRPKDAKGDISFIIEGFYQHTETAFYQRLEELSAEPDSDSSHAIRERWYRELKAAAIHLFDHWAASSLIEYENPRRVAQARGNLIKLLQRKLPKTMAIELTKQTEKAA